MSLSGFWYSVKFCVNRYIENGKSGAEVHHEEKEERLIKPEELLYRLEMGNAVHIIKGVPNPILGDLVPAFTYMSKNPKTSFDEFYDKKDISQMPHLTVTDNDLVFKNLITQIINIIV